MFVWDVFIHGRNRYILNVSNRIRIITNLISKNWDRFYWKFFFLQPYVLVSSYLDSYRAVYFFSNINSTKEAPMEICSLGCVIFRDAEEMVHIEDTRL